MNQNQQRPQHQHQSQSNSGYGSPPRNPQEQRREFLWRERVKLELQAQGLIARGESLTRQWHFLQDRKAAFGQRMPKVVGQIMLSGLVGIRQLPAERSYQYEKERLAQEEYRIQQEIMQCNSDAAAIQAQITVIDFELSLL